jgi:hypothetical protein
MMRDRAAPMRYFFSIVPSFFIIPSSLFIIFPSDIHPAAVPITIASIAAVIQRVIVASHSGSDLREEDGSARRARCHAAVNSFPACPAS